MSRLVTILALCSLLSACVIYTPSNVTYTTVVHNETTSSVVNAPEKRKTNEVSGRVVQNKHTGAQRSLAECGPFILPRDIRKPEPLTRAHVIGPRTMDAVDDLFLHKLNEYRTYVDSVHSKIEQAHQKWLESCQQKVPN